MSSRFRKTAFLALGVLAVSAGPLWARELKFCADPNNMPFSNDRAEGFENRIAKVVAEELGATATFEWAPEWRGFIRKGLGARRCDVVPGVPTGLERVRPTTPYYRASYAFVQPHGATPITSFDDPALREKRIGVQLVGNDGANTPPMTELARRGITDKIKGYMVIGDWSKPDPLAPIVQGVARGDVDLAVVWGPVADYYAARQSPPLQVTHIDDVQTMAFPISMGVRKPDAELAEEINRALERRQADIRNILAEYNIQSPGTQKKAATAE